MKLWTIQPVEVYEKLVKEKILYVDKSLSEFISSPEISLKDSYDWLVIQMKEKIGINDKAEYPWWAWYKRDYKHQKPDLRESAYEERGKKCVCIELDIDPSKVLLSDFDTWHMVLNDCWFNPALTESEYDRLEDWYDSLELLEQQRVKLESWKQIFDIKPYSNNFVRVGSYVQATFWELNITDVKKVVYFTAK